eukprot:9468958-Pyramimonas_sp.AAC.1
MAALAKNRQRTHHHSVSDKTHGTPAQKALRRSPELRPERLPLALPVLELGRTHRRKVRRVQVHRRLLQVVAHGLRVLWDHVRDVKDVLEGVTVFVLLPREVEDGLGQPPPGHIYH